MATDNQLTDPRNPYVFGYPDLGRGHPKDYLTPLESWKYQGMGEEYVIKDDANLRHVYAAVNLSEDALHNTSNYGVDRMLRDHLAREIGHHVAGLKDLYTIENSARPDSYHREVRAGVIVMSLGKLQEVVREFAEMAYKKGHDQGKEDWFNEGYNEGLNTDRDE